MTDIQKILNLLRNMRPSSKELIKIKILMACYDGWKSTHDIRRIANLGMGVQLRLVKLLIDDLIQVDSCKLIGNTKAATTGATNTGSRRPVSNI